MLRAVVLAVLWWSFAVAVHAAAVSPVIVPTVAEVESDPALPQWLDPPRQLTIQLPGMSHHFDEPVDKHGNQIKNREFNERNWGVGIQIERTLTGEWERWISKASFG